MTTLKTTKLNGRNKLVIVKENDLFTVISYKRNLLGFWKKSEFALDYQTNLTGQFVVYGKYNGFKTLSNATKWMNFLTEKFESRVKFIGI